MTDLRQPNPLIWKAVLAMSLVAYASAASIALLGCNWRW